MSIEPLTRPRPARRTASYRLSADYARPRQILTASQILRRRHRIIAAKWLLPAMSLALLSALALYPELDRAAEQGRVAFRRLTDAIGGAQLTDARYRGTDEHDRPYTLTASRATQVDANRVDMVAPKGDLSLQDGSWLMVEAKFGVFVQHISQLDLSHEVVLYRDDGTTMRTDSATVDMPSGAAASSDPVSAEGPFGTLDALGGFTLTDKGQIIQFAGPARLVMNGATR